MKQVVHVNEVLLDHGLVQAICGAEGRNLILARAVAQRDRNGVARHHVREEERDN